MKTTKRKPKIKVGDKIELKTPVKVTHGVVTSLTENTFRATFTVFGFTKELLKDQWQDYGGIVHETKKMLKSFKKLDQDLFKEAKEKIEDGKKPF